MNWLWKVDDFNLGSWGSEDTPLSELIEESNAAPAPQLEAKQVWDGEGDPIEWGSLSLDAPTPIEEHYAVCDQGEDGDDLSDLLG